MSDEDLIRNFSINNPLQALIEGRQPPILDAAMFDESLASLERAISVAATRDLELRTKLPDGHGNAQKAEMAGVLRNVRGFRSLLSAQLVASHDAGVKLVCRFGELLPGNVINDLGTQAQTWGASADEIDSVDLDELGRQLLRVTVNFRSYTMQIRKLFITPLLDAITGVQADADGPVQIEAQDALAEELDNLQENRVAALARRAAQSADNARRSSGAAAANRQHVTFAQTAQGEETRARFWTRCAFALILAGLAIPPITLFLQLDIAAASGWAGVLIKMLIALPLYGAAAYAARIAAQHREFGRHMQLMAVQVDTIESYIEPMDPLGQSEIRAILGRRLFSPIELISRETGHISVIPAELIPLLERVVEQSKSGGTR